MKTLDQYEIEEKFLHSGTIGDSIYKGTLGSRTLIASHVSGSIEGNFVNTYSQFFELSGSNRNRRLGMAQNFVRLQCPPERFYDTLLPSVYDAYQLNGGRFALAINEFGASPILITSADSVSGSGQVVGKMIFTTFGTTASINGTTSSVADGTWFTSFPFQGIYKNLSRTQTQRFYRSDISCSVSESNTASVVRYGLNGSPPGTSLSTVEVSVRDPRLSQTEPIRYTMIDVTGSVSASNQQFWGLGVSAFFFPPTSSGLFGLSQGTKTPAEEQMIKLFFGFGDNAQGVPIVEAVTGSYLYSGASPMNYYYATNVSIRGWKYGVLNGFPQNSSCIFRARRFGQPRDMLEQRWFTKTINTDGFTEDGLNNDQRGTREGPVTIRFVSGTQSAITASNSSLNVYDSGMYDIEAKRGQPFTDL